MSRNALFIILATISIAAPVSAEGEQKPIALETAGRAGAEPAEIVAAGDAVVVIPPDHATITVTLSQTAATALDASAKLDATTAQIRDVIKLLGQKWQMHLRDERYAPSGQTAGPLLASSAVVVRRDIAIESDEPLRVAQGIDKLTKLSGVSVIDVSFSVRSANAEQLELLSKAAAGAKLKAEKMAQGLGVRLGRMLSAQLTEETDGAMVRERLAQGESPLSFQDSRLKLYVTVRYEALQ